MIPFLCPFKEFLCVYCFLIEIYFFLYFTQICFLAMTYLNQNVFDSFTLCLKYRRIIRNYSHIMKRHLNLKMLNLNIQCELKVQQQAFNLLTVQVRELKFRVVGPNLWSSKIE
uniref:Uncharacterized protein n=1 Tax=Cacopsylla melanoneura TaxID=428564 RepID=A0A8D8VA65_9HEMI